MPQNHILEPSPLTMVLLTAREGVGSYELHSGEGGMLRLLMCRYHIVNKTCLFHSDSHTVLAVVRLLD